MNNYSSDLFDELWIKYNRKIYSYFRRQFDEHTAEDLCQQTYLKAWSHISAYSEISIKQNKSWLFAVARNVKNDYLRYIQLHSMNFKYENLYETDVTVENNVDESLAIQKAFAQLVSSIYSPPSLFVILLCHCTEKLFRGKEKDRERTGIGRPLAYSRH